MRILSAKETKATALQKKLIEKKNLFGLGVTSLIAACSADGEGAGGGGGKTPAGPIGKIPENPVPEKLTAAGQLAEASTERLAPVADIDSDHISATASVSVPEGTGTSGTLNDLVVTINKASGLVDNTFEMTFKNGNYTAGSASASVYELVAKGTNDLVVASADSGYLLGDSTTYGGVIYIVWDIKPRDGTPLDDANPTGNNFLRIVGSSSAPIGKYAPEFLHIGGENGTDDKARYDMIARADGTADGLSYIHIIWDVTQYAGTKNRSPTLTTTTIISHVDININKYPSEFFNIGGEAHHDMVIRGVGKEGADDRIYIVWDVANPSLFNKRIDIASGPTNGAVILNIYIERGDDKIASYAPEFSHIGGDDAQYDMVIRSGVDAGTDKIYILWDVDKYSAINDSIALDANAGSNIATHGLLRIFGEAENKKIDKYSPEFLQIGGVDAGAAPQQDMIIKSNDGSTIYILWDVAAYYDNTTTDKLKTPVDVDLSDDSTITNGLLKITGENIGKYDPEFLQIAGVDASNVAQHDMVIRSDTAIYVLWDVAEYYSATPTPINLSTNDGITKGLLKITGTTADTEIGQSAPDILKINNNDDYDMIIKSNTNMYVLWDFAKYGIFEGSPANVDINLTAASAATGNGLLTISGATADANVLKNSDGSFLDINDADNGDNNINDIVFTDKGNTFILFGEKIAYRDVNEKAVSHTVNLTAIKALDFGSNGAGFFTADAVTTVAADAIGYRFADVKTDLGNVALPSASLSDVDADLGVWDIA